MYIHMYTRHNDIIIQSNREEVEIVGVSDRWMRVIEHLVNQTEHMVRLITDGDCLMRLVDKLDH
jgi:hypothetical protein